MRRDGSRNWRAGTGANAGGVDVIGDHGPAGAALARDSVPDHRRIPCARPAARTGRRIVAAFRLANEP